MPFNSTSTAKSLPKRSDSLSRIPANQSTPNNIFGAIDDDLRDVRRVHAHGQEEDLRLALSRVIMRVEELSSLLKSAYKTQTELELSLSVAKSNLQLVQANNEMLEDALKRDDRGPGHARDVGWRRSSQRESYESVHQNRPGSSDSSSRESSLSPKSPIPSPNANLAPPPPNAENSRFFGIRFSNGANSGRNTPAVSRSPTPIPSSPNTQIPGQSQSNQTSASGPSSPPSHHKELEELQLQLEKERATSKKTAEDKAALEAELESLSQALFEEANKMVRHERIKRAETEEELKEARLEKEALLNTLRVVEGENGMLRGGMPNSDHLKRSPAHRALHLPMPIQASPRLLPLPPSPGADTELRNQFSLETATTVPSEEEVEEIAESNSPEAEGGSNLSLAHDNSGPSLNPWQEDRTSQQHETPLNAIPVSTVASTLPQRTSSLHTAYSHS